MKLVLEDTLKEFVGDETVKGVLTAKGSGFETEMVVISAGVRPVVDIAEDAGIKLGVTGAIKVNSRMETSIPDIYACGDCADKNFLVTQKPVWFALGTTANKEGRVVALNVCNKDDKFLGVTGAVVTKYFDFIKIDF